VPVVVPTNGGAGELSAVIPHPMLTVATNSNIAANPTARLREFFPRKISIIRTSTIPQTMKRPGESGIRRCKFCLGGAEPFAAVTTLKEMDPPATTLAAENVHVETGGHPAIENVTCPLSGGLSVLTVNVAVPPAVIDVEEGDAFSPAGIGPLKLNTVLPPHSAEFVPVGGQRVVSNAVTMKKYVVPIVTAICTCDSFTAAEASLLHATFVKFPAVPV
jgi:hypothetical protein